MTFNLLLQCSELFICSSAKVQDSVAKITLEKKFFLKYWLRGGSGDNSHNKSREGVAFSCVGLFSPGDVPVKSTLPAIKFFDLLLTVVG